MKDLFFQGHRVLTTDRVADAVMSYAQRLSAAGRTDIVEFPVVQDGALSTCTLLIGQQATSLASVGVPQAYPDTLTGANAAADEIQSREAALVGV
jgi:hypothetical protein